MVQNLSILGSDQIPKKISDSEQRLQFSLRFLITDPRAALPFP